MTVPQCLKARSINRSLVLFYSQKLGENSQEQVWIYSSSPERLQPVLGFFVSDVPSYVPAIPNKDIIGNVTSTTFLLSQPQCIFDQYSTNEVWLVVALWNVTAYLNDKNLSVPVNHSEFSSKTFYHTLRVFGSEFPCNNTNTSTLAILRVGSEKDCNGTSFCNAPLPPSGSYQVKFVVLNSSGLVTATNWSNTISLKKVDNYSTIDTSPGRRSGGMIVITTILSVLLGILLACSVASMVIGSKNIMWRETLDTEKVILEGPRKNQESFRKISENTYVPQMRI
ncbi:uroplakin-3b-like [Spea bombifrons]|uniref:uroplakin-3b-like n=1 Tax=Spea bombifrons TaxID=233779 RepID=UPI002349FCAA|nr:uroplakin-3b-like [Spea bombifrons]